MPDLTKAKCPCRGCKTEANNPEDVELLFGLRNMGNGTIRVQSYCRDCRGLKCEAADPQCR